MCIIAQATGFSPNLSNVWLKTPTSSQSVFGSQKADITAATGTKFVQQLCERLEWAYKTAQQIIEKENQRHKKNYDHKIKCTQLGVGDQVLLMEAAFKGKHKIQDH